MSFRADLHCHSTCSDGTYTPMELLELAKERGLQGLAITDHDTLEAYTQEIFAQAKKLGIQILIGVEFSTIFQQETIHVLGYNLALTDTLYAFCNKHHQYRQRRNQAILERLTSMGLMISEKELLEAFPQKVLGRPHIARIMIRKGYVKSIKEAFSKYIGDGKCCFVQGEKCSLEETLQQIHQAKGKAFLAHPHLIRRQKLIPDLLEYPFDGIECYYSLTPKQQEEKWVALAKKHQLLISGGSDFHGEIKPQIPLGCSWVDAETFEKILL